MYFYISCCFTWYQVHLVGSLSRAREQILPCCVDSSSQPGTRRSAAVLPLTRSGGDGRRANLRDARRRLHRRKMGAALELDNA